MRDYGITAAPKAFVSRETTVGVHADKWHIERHLAAL
jgi:hypothetical protein